MFGSKNIGEISNKSILKIVWGATKSCTVNEKLLNIRFSFCILKCHWQRSENI